jgi:hypothetical protein
MRSSEHTVKRGRSARRRGSPRRSLSLALLFLGNDASRSIAAHFDRRTFDRCALSIGGRTFDRRVLCASSIGAHCRAMRVLSSDADFRAMRVFDRRALSIEACRISLCFRLTRFSDASVGGMAITAVIASRRRSVVHCETFRSRTDSARRVGRFSMRTRMVAPKKRVVLVES